MRILHTSDWHLGMELHGESLLQDQREMVERLLETVEREQVEAVVLAGDVFDHAIAKPEAIGLYNDAMTGLCLKLKVPVLLLSLIHISSPGNTAGIPGKTDWPYFFPLSDCDPHTVTWRI